MLTMVAASLASPPGAAPRPAGRKASSPSH